jgi:hypothetical protein
MNPRKLKLKKKQKNIVNKDKTNTKISERINCECGCTSSRNKISRHEKSVCHQNHLDEKEKLKRNLTDEELDIFFL